VIAITVAEVGHVLFQPTGGRVVAGQTIAVLALEARVVEIDGLLGGQSLGAAAQAGLSVSVPLVLAAAAHVAPASRVGGAIVARGGLWRFLVELDLPHLINASLDSGVLISVAVEFGVADTVVDAVVDIAPFKHIVFLVVVRWSPAITILACAADQFRVQLLFGILETRFSDAGLLIVGNGARATASIFGETVINRFRDSTSGTWIRDRECFVVRSIQLYFIYHAFILPRPSASAFGVDLI